MISSQIINTNKFVKLSNSAKSLYLYLLIQADDDGFIGNSTMVINSIGVTQENLDELINSEYVYSFDDGVLVIRDWLIHNTIRKDRYTKTFYQEDFRKLKINENKQYELLLNSKEEHVTSDNSKEQKSVTENSSKESKPVTNNNSKEQKHVTSFNSENENRETQDKLSKDKSSKDNNINKLSSSENIDPEPEQKSKKIPYEKIIDYLNRKTDSHFRPTTKSYRKLIKARYNEGFTDMDFKTVIDKKCAEWLQDGNMVQYLRPETLFSSKFATYLGQRNTGSIPRRNFGSKPVRRATDWNAVEARLNANENVKKRKMTDEERDRIFREFSSGYKN